MTSLFPEKTELVLAIDPGIHGAIAVFVNGVLVHIRDIPITSVEVNNKHKNRVAPYSLLDILKDIKHYWEVTDSYTVYAIIEQAHVRPNEGAVGAFSFGQGYGFVEMACISIGSVVEHVDPAMWKRELKLRRDKTKSRELAAQLFPKFAHWFEQAKDDGRAEAVLIGHWWLTRKGDDNEEL